MPISAYLLTTLVYTTFVDHPDPACNVLNSKSQSMLFSRKHNKPAHPQLHMNNIAIEHVESHKHLGITLSSDAKWYKTHLSYTGHSAETHWSA